jgi:CheY-like chemotaxis protein
MDLKKILLVDDEPHVTLVLSRKLERAGFSTRIARDGEEGFAVACEFMPDLVISDLQMPRVDGLTLATNLAANKSTSSIPILMLSGRGFLLDKSLAESTRIVRVLEKPFAASDIIQNALDIVSSSNTSGEQAA